VRRHEVLRTCYLSVDGSPVQKISPPELFRVSVVDLQGLPVADREPEVVSLASSFARQPFDLRNAPLLRAHVLKLSPDEHVLLLNLHHIACDWWSFGVFEKELAALYDAFVRGEASPLPELPVQYVDFTAWQQRAVAGRNSAGTTGLLAREVKRRIADAGTPKRSAASCRPDLQRIVRQFALFPRS
jgi:hypothetical protein